MSVVLFAQSNPDPGGLLALAGGTAVIALIPAILVIAGMWKVFDKCGQPGWAAIVPIYNVYVLAKIGREQLAIPLVIALVATVIPIVQIVAAIVVFVLGIIVAIGVGERFNKGAGWSVVLLWLLGFIGYPLLGFGDAQPSGVAPSDGVVGTTG